MYMYSYAAEEYGVGIIHAILETGAPSISTRTRLSLDGRQLRLVAERTEPIKEWRDDGCPTTESKFCVQGFVDSPQCYPSENHASMLVLVIVLHV